MAHIRSVRHLVETVSLPIVSSKLANSDRGEWCWVLFSWSRAGHTGASIRPAPFGKVVRMINVITSESFEDKMASYPSQAQQHLDRLRSLVREVAKECDDVDQLEETLKWGEPSYLSPIGSTMRMDWKERAPGEVALYFNCTSRLVDTFREIYGEQLDYEKNRAIILPLDSELPEAELRSCIEMALRYHRVKNLPQLGLGE